MISFPSYPSTIPNLPSQSSGKSTPIRAGIFIVRARIAVCEFVDPPRVTNERTMFLSSCTVSDGARSSARRIDGSSPVIFDSSTP